MFGAYHTMCHKENIFLFKVKKIQCVGTDLTDIYTYRIRNSEKAKLVQYLVLYLAKNWITKIFVCEHFIGKIISHQELWIPITVIKLDFNINTKKKI